MRLKSLEIYGFKSFGQKTILEFPYNITLIIGPNGSGKSNVVDALRWALGEQSLKSIRVNDTKDIIFTHPQKTLNLCWVRINFDDEIVIERKLFRDGTSDYLLNGQVIRLKDLQIELAKMKLSTKSLNIINQGAADLFFRASPQQKYEMILDMIGVKEYEFKKQEALKKIQQTKENINQIKIRLQETKPQLKFFQKEKEKAEKVESLKKEIFELQEELEIAKYFNYSKKVKEYEEKLAKLRLETEEIEKKLNESELKITKTIEDDEIKKLEEEKIKLLQEKNKILSQAIVTKPQTKTTNLINFIIEELKKILNLDSLEEIKNRIKYILAKVEEQPVSHLDIKPEIQKIDQKLDEVNYKISNLVQERKIKEAERQKYFYEFKNLQYQFLKNKEEIDHLEQALKFFYEELKKLKKPSRLSFKNIETLEAEIKIKENLLYSLGNVDEEVLKEYDKLKERVDKLEKELFDLESSLANLNYFVIEIDNRIKNEFSKAMKSINDNFNYYFNQIFAGGRVKLTWKNTTKEVDVLIQLPGKKLSTFDSLSGGEKALTSIALICSLIKTTQPIFVVLDEVDAPLDEVNAVKFANLIKELSQLTQFIIVSHNRATMEIAQTLYGVSIDEDGSSRVISLKLT